jgi:hypothetical protein
MIRNQHTKELQPPPPANSAFGIRNHPVQWAEGIRDSRKFLAPESLSSIPMQLITLHLISDWEP